MRTRAMWRRAEMDRERQVRKPLISAR